jgi:hypothetical protein
MSLFAVEFDELFARHLCRHSQLGINVVHLAALFGVWFGVYGAVYWLVQTEWVPIALAALYLLAVAVNVPLRVTVACAFILALFVTAVLGLPQLPLWAYLLMIPVFYKIQSWSHKVWTVEHDMTDFNKKYTKGSVLFVILLIYEVPIVLHYLLFSGRSGSVSDQSLENSA